MKQKSVRGWPPSSKILPTRVFHFFRSSFHRNSVQIRSSTFHSAFVYFVLLLIRLNGTIEIVDREIDVTRNAALIEKNNRGRKSTFKYREFYSRDRNLFRRLRRKIGRVERSRWKIAIAEYRAKTRKRTRMHNRVRKTRRRSHARTLACLYV